MARLMANSFDASNFEETYRARKHLYDSLVDEVIYILRNQIEKARIKVHQIDGRTKGPESIIKKCSAKELADPLSSLSDIAGIRVICLFRSDLSQIGGIIVRNFQLESKDNKIESSSDSFGYMSIHYVCRLKEDFRGPRYDPLKGIKFEIQVRTLAMHSWAAISHYLEYKGDWDVPGDLKKSLNALSGLFYVADTEFERIYAARESSARSLKAAKMGEEINLDTMMALLNTRYPDRLHTDVDGVSALVQELKEGGYQNLHVVVADLDKAFKTFLRYEHDLPSGPMGPSRFADVGVVRVSLSIASEEYLSSRKDINPKSVASLRAYRRFMSIDSQL